MPPSLPLRHIAMIPVRTQVRVRSSGDTKYALKASSSSENSPLSLRMLLLAKESNRKQEVHQGW